MLIMKKIIYKCINYTLLISFNFTILKSFIKYLKNPMCGELFAGLTECDGY